MIVEAIVGMLAKEGLGLLAGAVAGGKEKAVELIKKETGIDIKDIADPNTETKLLPDQVVRLKEFESSKTLDLAKIVAGADKGKAGGIVLAAIAPEIPEVVLFLMGLLLVLGFAAFTDIQASSNLASAWLGAFAMYVKGK